MATQFDYVADLEEAFFVFEEQFGFPDTRVQVLSLRDDILGIPTFGVPASGGAARVLTETERTILLRAALTDKSNYDREGMLKFAF